MNGRYRRADMGRYGPNLEDVCGLRPQPVPMGQAIGLTA